MFALSTLLLATAPAAASDDDRDGVADELDNCLEAVNPTQLDTDADGFGNACDADYDDDGVCGLNDQGAFQQAFASVAGSPSYRPELDADGDGSIGLDDMAVVSTHLFGPPGPSGLACAGTPYCGCHPPQLDSVEEVLSGDVELRWTASAGASVEIERGTPGGAWTPLASAAASDGGYLDASPTPRFYAYRLRSACSDGSGESRFSGYSNVATLELPEECAGQPPLPPQLPIVTIRDRNSDGRYTGADILLALNVCGIKGGCILEALPVVYDDVALLISDGNPAPCTPGTLQCLGTNVSFPSGLVIQGHGSRTVFRSPIWAQPYTPSRLLHLWKRPDIRLRLRNLVLDGRKQEQSNPAGPEGEWFHYGFESWNHYGTTLPKNRDGCIHNVATRNFFRRGITLKDTAGWIVEYSTVEDIGCHGVTPCPLLTAPDLVDTLAYKSTGYGIYMAANDDLVIRNNVVRRVAKYAIGLKSEPPAPPLLRPTVLRNRVENTGLYGLFVSGVRGGLFAENVIDGTHAPGELYPANFSSAGISVPTGLVEDSQLRDNAILDSAGIGIAWHATGSGNVLANNLIRGSCIEKDPSLSYSYSDLYIDNRTSNAVQLENNEVSDSHCAASLGILGSSGVYATVRGGVYESGLNANGPVELHDVVVEGGALFKRRDRRSGACMTFVKGSSTGVTGIVTSSVNGDGCSPLASADAQSTVIDCDASPATCTLLCARSSPPAWCAY